MEREILGTPVTGPSAWTGATAAAADSWLRTLTDGEVGELEAAARVAAGRGLAPSARRRPEFKALSRV